MVRRAALAQLLDTLHYSPKELMLDVGLLQS
jgi:hypothetical protein